MVDPLIFLCCLPRFCHIGNRFASYCFPGSTAMVLGYQASVSETTCDFFLGFFFFLIRPTDPISANAFDAKRKKKGGRGGFKVTLLGILKGLGHAILGNFSTDRMVVELTKISK